VCPPGSKNNGSYCEGCDAGKYLKSFNECAYCPVGKFSGNESNSLCAACPKNSYSKEGGTFCSSCPLNAVTEAAESYSKFSCYCPFGFYGRAYAGEPCTKCLDTLILCAMNSTYPRLPAGLYRNPVVYHEYLNCNPRTACLETPSSQMITLCSDGYTGNLCGKCKPFEYFKQGSDCLKCRSNGVNYLVIVCFALFAAFFVTIFSWKGLKLASELKLTFMWLQIIAIQPNLFSNWPNIMQSLFRFLAFFNLDIDLIALECVSSRSFWFKFYLKLSLPIIFMFLFLMIWTLRFIKANGLNLLTLERMFERCIFTYVLVTSFFFTLIVSTIVSPFNCIAQNDGTYNLWNDSSIKCFVGEWSSVHLSWIVLFSTIYVILYFIIVCLCYWRHTDIFEKRGRYIIENRLSALTIYLIRNYRPQVFWWEIIRFVERTTIIILGSFSSRNDTLRVYILLFSILIFLSLEIFLSPYVRSSTLSISVMWNAVYFFILLSYSMVFSNPDIKNRDVGEVFVIIFAVLAIIASFYHFWQTHKSRISKKIYYGDQTSVYDFIGKKLAVYFKVDKETLRAAQLQKIVQSKITLSWLPVEDTVRTSFDATPDPSESLVNFTGNYVIDADASLRKQTAVALEREVGLRTRESESKGDHAETTSNAASNDRKRSKAQSNPPPLSTLIELS
jgi:hypothetical protein